MLSREAADVMEVPVWLRYADFPSHFGFPSYTKQCFPSCVVDDLDWPKSCFTRLY